MRNGWVAVASCIAAVSLLFLRRPDAFLNPQFWAEDGTVFFAQAHALGGASVLEPYNGYYHLVPRLAALISLALPIRHAPTLFNAIAVGCVLLVIARLFSPRLPLDSRSRVLMALAIVASPLQPEVFLNLTNAQWYLGLLGPLVLISKPAQSRWGGSLDILMLLIAGLTGPQIGLLVPLFAWAAWRSRTSSASAHLAISALTAVLQFAGAGSRLSTPVVTSLDWFASVLALIGGRIGYIFGGRAFEAPTLALLAFPFAVMLLAYLVLSTLRASQSPLPYFLGTGCILAVSAFISSAANPIHLLMIERYAFIPTVTMIWSLILLLGRRPFVPTILLICAVVASLSTFTLPSFADYHWPEASACQSPCTAPINPPGWAVRIP